MTKQFSRAHAVGLTLAVLAAGWAPGLSGPAAGAPADPSSASAAATGTSAGTIVYILDHNVWIARGDGSGARALTTDGTFALPYVSPTQSDGGVVVAARAERLVRMDQSGRVLTVLDPPPLPTSVSVDIDGTPVDAAISPDGTKIAYTHAKYLAPSGVSPGIRRATGYTAADRLTDPAPRRTTFFWAPSWVGNSRTLQSGGYHSNVKLHDLGKTEVQWFNDDDIYFPDTDLGNTELTRDGKYLAAVRGFDATSTIHWYAVNGDARSGPAPAAPTPVCQIGPLEGITNPTWAPDSDSLAWQEPDGIWTRSGAGDCTVPSALILPGGSQPHWSPAALSAPQPAVLKNRTRPTITGKPRPGGTLTASTGTWSLPQLRYRYQWSRNGTKITGRAGTARTYRVLRSDVGRKLSVRVTATKDGRSATATSTAITIKR